MVTERKIINKIGVVLTLILFFLAAIAVKNIEDNTIMGVQIMCSSEYEQIPEAEGDFDIRVLFNDAPAPVDEHTKTIYIPQLIDDKTRYTDLKGTLSADNKNYRLLFLESKNLENLQQSVKDNCRHTLLVISPEGRWQKYNVIFTTLPVFNIYGDYAGQHNPWREKFEGQIYFFDPDSVEYNDYRTVTADASWHRRGNTVELQPKSSWKITLHKPAGENKNESFCGLGEDDDWILNAMVLDDLKMREKILIDLWNQNKVFTDSKAIMSKGEYAELVLNGEYKGLYLLQRRIDSKYLGLEEENILIKGNTYYPEAITADYFEIKYSPYSEQETRDFLSKKFVADITANLNIENLTDTDLFINMACALDNRGEKNIFRLFSNIEGDFDVNYILWDTDMSFGLQWEEGIGFTYAPDKTVYQQCYRKESAEMFAQNPELEKIYAQRWFELRQTIFSNENMTETVGDIYGTIAESGSVQRDCEKWGLYYDGKDTMENLYTFIDMRLEYLDRYYVSFL